ncbi:hypothetical protein GQ607_013129 [Colletotrichum asianum]|uniref:Uncharacterized protein n=1 Tax=Colletotrichum asianum TaxID=702518 RepID=A0A8H3W439_9PEZI|nr:hypothetical protein GQ607_013129 [Colletotrichum asianum]
MMDQFEEEDIHLLESFLGQKEHKELRRRRLCGLLSWETVAALGSVSVLAAVFYLLRSSPFTDGRPFESKQDPIAVGPPCGPSWRQAEAAGCVYDLLMSAWVPPHCHDADLYRQYVADVNSTFYLDRQQESRVAWDVVLSGRHPDPGLWTDGGFHHLHCTYIWERQHRAYKHAAATGEPMVLDSHCRNDTHTSHCIWWNGRPRAWEIDKPNITRIYPPREPIRCLVDV